MQTKVRNRILGIGMSITLALSGVNVSGFGINIGEVKNVSAESTVVCEYKGGGSSSSNDCKYTYYSNGELIIDVDGVFYIPNSTFEFFDEIKDAEKITVINSKNASAVYVSNNFSGFTNLKEVDLSAINAMQMSSIFINCPKLERIKIPKKATYIEQALRYVYQTSPNFDWSDIGCDDSHYVTTNYTVSVENEKAALKKLGDEIEVLSYINDMSLVDITKPKVLYVSITGSQYSFKSDSTDQEVHLVCDPANTTGILAFSNLVADKLYFHNFKTIKVDSLSWKYNSVAKVNALYLDKDSGNIAAYISEYQGLFFNLAELHYNLEGVQSVNVNSFKNSAPTLLKIYTDDVDNAFWTESLWLAVNRTILLEKEVSESPSVEVQSLEAYAGDEVDFEVNFGSGDKKAKKISKLLVDGVAYNGFSVSGTTVTLGSSITSVLSEGVTHTISVEFDDVSNTVEDSKVSLYIVKKPSIEVQNIETTGNDVKFNVNLNSATGIKSLVINGNKIPTTDYSCSSNGVVTIKGSYFERLENDVYNLSVEFNDTKSTKVEGKVIITVNIDTELPSVESQSLTVNGREDIELTVNLGKGYNKATGVLAVKIDNVTVNATLEGNKIKIAKEELAKLIDGTHKVSIEFNDILSTVVNDKVEIVKITEADVEPQLVNSDITYNRQISNSLEIKVQKGNTGKSITDVKIGGVSKEYTLSSDGIYTVIRIDKSKITEVVGLYELQIDFTGDYKLNGSLEIIENDGKAKLVKSTELYDAMEKNTVEYTIEWNTASSITKVYVNGKSIAFEVEGNKLKLNSTALANIENGTYSVVARFDNGNVDGTNGTLIVVGYGEDNGDGGNGSDELPPSVVDTVNYKFYKDYASDIMIALANATKANISEIQVGDTIIDSSLYKLDNMAIILSKDIFKDLNQGKYRLVIKFDDKNATTLSNVTVDVYDSFEKSDVPTIMNTLVVCESITSDVVMTYSLGEGTNKANSIIGLAIDDKVVDSYGNEINLSILDTQEMSNIVESASGSAISTENSDTEWEESLKAVGFGITTIENNLEPIYKVVGNKVIVSMSYLQSLGLDKGTHLMGAQFDDTARTLSYGVIISLINTGSDSDDGNGNGNGSGDGSGNGSGDGSGNGSGNGSGDGSGNGSGDGSGNGNGSGSGNGGGSGNGNGTGGGSSSSSTTNNNITNIYNEIKEEEPEYGVPYVDMVKYMPAKTKFTLKLYNVSNYKVLYSSSKPSVAGVSQTGVITAKKKGTAMIDSVVYDKDGNVVYKVQLKVIVTKATKKGATTKFAKYNASSYTETPVFVLDKKLYVNANTKLGIGNISNNYTVECESSNASIAEVLKDGKVYGKKAGKAVLTITIKQDNGSKYVYKYNVTVVK